MGSLAALFWPPPGVITSPEWNLLLLNKPWQFSICWVTRVYALARTYSSFSSSTGACSQVWTWKLNTRKLKRSLRAAAVSAVLSLICLFVTASLRTVNLRVPCYESRDWISLPASCVVVTLCPPCAHWTVIDPERTLAPFGELVSVLALRTNRFNNVAELTLRRCRECLFKCFLWGLSMLWIHITIWWRRFLLPYWFKQA